MTDLEYLKLSKLGKLRHDFLKFIMSLPGRIFGGIKGFLMMFVKIGQWFFGEWLPASKYEAIGLEFELHSENSVGKMPTLELFFGLKKKEE